MHEGRRVDGEPLPPSPPGEATDALPAIGDIVGGYRILGRLGAGGMGQVFRARDDDLERDVALKLLHPKLTSQPRAMSRFRREARLLAAVHHPNIATLFGTFEDGGVRFLVMELVDGETLAKRLRAGRMAVPEALAIARQIATALEAAHRKGIVHRDLKPANVMVSPEGWVKVLDFGLAKMLFGEEGSGAVSDETRAQGALGTAPYMSPEQLCGLETDWRIDVWAFGCVLFELVTGKRAFTGKSRTEIVRAILDAEPSWSELPAELPAPAVDLLRRCLAKDVYLRPPMSHIRVALEESLAGLPRISGPAEGDSTTLGIDSRTLGIDPQGPLPSLRETEKGTRKKILLDWARQRPVEAIAAAGALLMVLGTGLGILGLVTERAREGLIGLPPLSYSKSDLVLTGVQSLWSLPWRAAASLAAPHPVLRTCAFAGLLLAAALLAGAWFPRRRILALITLAFSASVLIAGAWLYSAAVHTGLETPGPGRGLVCEEQLSLRWDVSAAFETCTWLINDTRRNEGRRQALGGVLGFLLLAAGGGAWMGARSQGLGPRGSWARWGLVAVHAALMLFFLRLVPAAHAYSTWGVRYPPVTVRTDLPGCDQALGQALEAGSCCAFNVSEDATEGTVLLLWGSGCPGGAGFKAPQDVEAIGKGCLSQALTPQTVNSRCL